MNEDGSQNVTAPEETTFVSVVPHRSLDDGFIFSFFPSLRCVCLCYHCCYLQVSHVLGIDVKLILSAEALL